MTIFDGMSSKKCVVVLLVFLCLLPPFVMCQRRTGGGLKTNRTSGRSGSGISFDSSGRLTNSSTGSSSSGGINTLRNMHRGGGLSVGGTTSTTTTTPIPSIPISSINIGNQSVSVGLIVPFSMFQRRDYERAVSNVMLYLQKGKVKYDFLQKYRFTTSEVLTLMITVSPSPRGKKSEIKNHFYHFTTNNSLKEKFSFSSVGRTSL